MDRGISPDRGAGAGVLLHAWSENMLSDALFDPKASLHCRRGRGGAACWLRRSPGGAGRGYIDNIAVEEAARRHGVGDALLDVFCRFGQAHLSFLTLDGAGLQRPRHRPL